MNTSQVSLAFIFLCFLISYNVASSDPTHFTDDIVSVSCGSTGISAYGGRQWLGDVQPTTSQLLQLNGLSTTSTASSKLASADQLPYKTARVSRSQFSYAFRVNSGQIIVRLHFNPSAYTGFKGLKDLFTVEAGSFTLLANFSASLTANALRVNSLTKEFCFNLQENQLLDITFSAETSQTKDAYAFINGIEIISVPASLSYFQDRGIGLQVVGQNSLIYVDNSIALEMIYRQNIKQADDSGDIFGMWPRKEVGNIKNVTWKISVDVGFRYLIRLHFSKLGLKLAESGGLNFKVFINEMIADTNADIVVKERDGSSIPWYGDYMVMMNGRKQEGKRDLLIRLQTNDEFMDGILKGFEVLKLSNPDNSLASPIPMPSSHDSTSQTFQILLTVLGNRNAIESVAITILCIVCLIVHKLREISEASSSEEANRPSARAERLCRHFSLSEMQLATRNFSDGLIIGRGGFGKVYKGLIDTEKNTVAVKRLKPNSSQGAREFLTEIETLSELRHINLVSLVGYCSEGREMILVYEYMACGTLGDHLYNFARRDIDASPLTWKQRLNICIGAARGLDYLHTGHRVIHRDAYAFINGIEIISVPVNFSYFQGQDIGLHVVGQRSLVYVDNSIALEIIRKQIVKQEIVSSADDSDEIFRVWAMGNLHEVSNSKNVSWKICVDVGFRYLVRLHFSKLGLKMAENGALNFKVFINEMIANTNVDVLVKERDGSSISWYGDYMVMMNGRKLEGKRDLLIRLQSNEEFMDGTLKGFEILKISNHDNSLASPIYTPPSHDSTSQTTRILLKVLGDRNAIGTVVITIISVVCVIVHKLREIWEASSSEEENKPSEKAARVCRRFSLSEMQLATRNFSDGLLLGRGGFGKVYKGIIDKEQITVAVKRLKSNSKQGAREFLMEIETLSELRHINLVSLIGYCREGREMILVYEYMACGTLADHLYNFARRGIEASLTWKQRLNICIGAARGIDYLHTGQRVVHRDVKTSNILLDENFVARVSDFGLAKPEDRSKLQSHVSTKVKGTFGYLDPYYFTTRRLTRKSDSYAFGVVLLEVLCGRPAVDSGVSEDTHILTMWARDKISKGEVDQIVASSLSDEISPKSLKAFVGITERCLDYEPMSRPTMSQVVLQLEFALEQQESNQNFELNEIEKGTQLSSTLQPTVDSISMQHLTLPPNQQTNNKVDNTDVISGRKHREKSSKYKATRSWSWEAFWKRVKPSKKYESLLSEKESFAAVLKLPKFDWDQIAASTNHFSSSKSVGYGRFGTFYKAVLPSGELVAVKRGSSSSAYAQKLVKMESIVLSNLQHPNIVKLLGYCMEGETLWLLYEFMEKRSLDYIIDGGQQPPLQWAVRFQIIMGIARGLVYLHHDSGLSVIHGDLKLANILLDLNMSPKISGLYFSRSAVEYQSELEISLVQEIGYMFPEYLMHMKSTVKTDVCSLGIILLEIVSGRRRYSHIESRSLVEQAWNLWNEGRAIDIVDDSLGSAFEENEAITCIKVALLCIQENTDQRPLMSSVIKMLEGNEQIIQPCLQPPSEVPAGISENTCVDNDGLDSSIATFELDER